MYNAALYSKFNKAHQEVTRNILNNYGHLITWKKEMLDVGCAEGSNLMKAIVPWIPNKDISITGIDISEEMIKQANEAYGTKNVQFFNFGIDDPHLPKKIKKKFDTIISFHTLHYVNDQETTFKNMFDLLKPNGELFIVRIPFAAYFEVFSLMSEEPNPPDYLRTKRYCEFYRQVKDDNSLIMKKTKEFLAKFGFKDIRCDMRPNSYRIDTLEEFIKLHVVVNPYWKSIPNNQKGRHFQNFLAKYFKDGVNIEYDENTEEIHINMVFDSLVIVASKS